MNRAGTLLLILAFSLSLRDVFSHSEDTHDTEDFKEEFGDEETTNAFTEGTEDEPIEVREHSQFVKPQAFAGKDLPTLRIAFCVSCGYKQAFEQLTQYVHEKYPNMEIQGSNYPPAPLKAYLAQFISIVKMGLIITIVFGMNPIERLGFGYPAPLQWAHGNKLSAVMMIFLLSNMMEGTLMATGAFEVFLGDHQLWSKIESGRVPSPGELIQMIDAQLEILGKGPASGTGFSGSFN